MAYDPSTVGKWLGMRKEIAPQITRVALLGNPKTAAYYDYLLGAAQAVAPSLGIEAVASRIENDGADIERVIGTIAQTPNSGMIVLPEATTTVNRHFSAFSSRSSFGRIPKKRFGFGAMA
jgi:hypothetical protein